MTVSVWSGVPVLLDDLNHAIDPVAGLRRACEWARTQAGGGRVAVVEDGSGRVVAAAPDDARVYRDDLRVPIRLSGELIGWVVAGRAGCDAHSLEGCAQVLAAACGPAVRAVRAGAEVETVARGLAGELLGTSAAMTALRAAIVKVAATGFPVVIEGESGVGKELVARAIHRLSPRGRQRLAAINCAALTDELFDAELFGHARGAFTGAVGARPGLFEDADRGTIFLDEVADLTPRAQAKLLRVLQEREVRRVGENTARAVDVRVVAATNRSLRPAVERGDFRQDLHFRLAVVRLEVPPLRERPEDVPVLAAAAWHRLTRDRSIRSWLSPQAIAALCRHRWPGNVRELHNVMAGLVVAAPAQGAVSAGHVAAVIEGQGGAAPASAVSLESARRALDQTMVRGALARHAGCRAAAARDLGLSRQGLAKLMVRLAIDTAPVANDPPFR